MVKLLFENYHQFPTRPDELLPHAIYDSNGVDMVEQYAPQDGSCSLDRCHTGCCQEFVDQLFNNAKNSAGPKNEEKLQKAIKTGKINFCNCFLMFIRF